MRAKRWLLIGAVLLLGGAIAFALVAFGPTVEQAPEPPAPPVVRVMPATPESITVEVRSQGETQPRTRSQLVAQVGGRIARVAPQFAAGAFFEKGDALVWLDDADYRLAVQRAQAQVAQARVALEQERAQAEVAKEEWQDLGRGKPSALVLRKPQLAQAEAALEAAKAAAAQARLELERTTLHAPFNGRIRATQADIGQFVGAGSALAELYATDYAEVRLPVQERDLRFLPVSLGYPGEGDQGPPVVLSDGASEWRGTIVRVAGTVDPKTRLIDLYARVEDPFNRARQAQRAALPMGLFVQARIQGRTLENVVVLPRAALRDGQVLVVEDGRLAFRDVEVVRTRGEDAVLEAKGLRGLRAGVQVVVSPLETPVAGMSVRTVPAEGAPQQLGARR
jgi:RND family efflux transporter MFP subunit